MESNDKKQDPFKKDRERNDALNKADHYNEQKLPGNYPMEEDIMNQKDLHRTEYSEDNEIPIEATISGIRQDSLDDDLGPALTSNKFDLSTDDLSVLGIDELEMDGGDDELLRERGWPISMTGGDLDVPGVELDDEGEDIGSEDEENNFYSLDDNSDDSN